MNIYRPMIKISKDCTMNVARLKDLLYFEWDYVVYATRTLEEFCKAHQFDATMALTEMSKQAQEDGLYD
jgi:hypothetical protein